MALALLSPSADAASTAMTDSASGNTLRVVAFYDVNGGACLHGDTAYRFDHATYKYTRTDGQFTASFGSGMMGEFALPCSGGGAINDSKAITGPNTELLTPGTVYSRGFTGTLPWVDIDSGVGPAFNANVTIKLHRDPQQHNAGSLCAEASPIPAQNRQC